MSTFFAFLFVGFLLALPVLFLMLIVKAIRKKPVKKTALSMLGCFIGMIVSVIIFSVVDLQSNCEHEFEVIKNVGATCTTEGKIVQQCTKCNKETEEILPAFEHEWQDADCENPKTCQLCEETDGEKGGHKWAEATCEAPKTCSSCGLTEGEALSADRTHSWKAATCTEPKTCTICSVAEGTTIEHTLGEWEVIDEGTSEKQGTRQQKCVVCETIINTEKFDPPSKLVTDIVKKTIAVYSGKTELETIIGDEDNSIVVTGSIYCENSEQVVKNILSAIAEELHKVDNVVECIFVIGDIGEDTESECLAMASIDSEGNYKITSMSINFKTERNEWITNQFSVWDGSHTVLKGLIKDNLNDEKSFEHIETTYIDVATEDKRKQVNDILEQSGYSQRVDVGDLFVITKFSAKNAFNATVKNTAYGIVDYSADLVTLIAIE